MPRRARSHEETGLDLLTIIGLAFGLAMDAFAVSIAVGLTLPRLSLRPVFRLGWHFGFFQFLMPVLGWLAGRTVADQIAAVDHWVAFGLLVGIGAKMVWEARGAPTTETDRTTDPTRGLSLVVLSVATSIDALAVGVTLALEHVRIWLPSVVIGVVALGMTVLGMTLGRRAGRRLGRLAWLLGGLILAGIGTKILVEHLTAG